MGLVRIALKLKYLQTPLEDPYNTNVTSRDERGDMNWYRSSIFVILRHLLAPNRGTKNTFFTTLQMD